jgi:Ala-tRNA(Pro) deacylase
VPPVRRYLPDGLEPRKRGVIVPRARDAFPGWEVGAMPLFGNLFGIPLYVDRLLEQDDEIVFNAGTHPLTAKLAFHDFVRITNPRIAEFSVQR